MSAPSTPPERRDLGRLLRGRRAESALAGLIAPAAPRLELDGSSLIGVDAYGAAVARTAVEVHLSRNRRHSVSLIEPHDSECWALVSDLLGGALPSRCSWAGTRSPALRGNYVLVPAEAIADAEDVRLLLDHTIRPAAGALGYGDRAGQLLQEAAAVFLHNAEQHAPGAAVPPVVCASLDPQANDLQLTSVNLRGTRSDATSDEAALRGAIAKSRSDNGALTELVSRPRGGLDVSLHLAWGTGRAHFRTSQSWHFATGVDVPGFVAGVEVHL